MADAREELPWIEAYQGSCEKCLIAHGIDPSTVECCGSCHEDWEYDSMYETQTHADEYLGGDARKNWLTCCAVRGALEAKYLTPTRAEARER